MIGSDVAVAWIHQQTGQAQVQNYYLNSRLTLLKLMWNAFGGVSLSKNFFLFFRNEFIYVKEPLVPFYCIKCFMYNKVTNTQLLKSCLFYFMCRLEICNLRVRFFSLFFHYFREKLKKILKSGLFEKLTCTIKEKIWNVIWTHKNCKTRQMYIVHSIYFVCRRIITTLFVWAL